MNETTAVNSDVDDEQKPTFALGGSLGGLDRCTVGERSWATTQAQRDVAIKGTWRRDLEVAGMENGVPASPSMHP